MGAGKPTDLSVGEVKDKSPYLFFLAGAFLAGAFLAGAFLAGVLSTYTFCTTFTQSFVLLFVVLSVCDLHIESGVRCDTRTPSFLQLFPNRKVPLLT